MNTRARSRLIPAPRTALVACLGAGFQLLTLSMTYAWLPTYFNRYYGLAPDQAGDLGLFDQAETSCELQPPAVRAGHDPQLPEREQRHRADRDHDQHADGRTLLA